VACLVGDIGGDGPCGASGRAGQRGGPVQLVGGSRQHCHSGANIPPRGRTPRRVANDTDAASLYPLVAAHLRACGPCAEDLAGLLAAVRENLPR
jgi:hypothetical protein